MVILSKIIRYILLLTIFNANISLSLNKEKQSLILLGENEEKQIVMSFREKGREEETCTEIDITNDELGSFNITEKCVKATINVKNGTIFNMTLFPFNKGEDNITKKPEELEDNVIQLKIDSSKIEKSIDAIFPEKKGKINFLKVSEKQIYKYSEILAKDDTSQQSINECNNIIRFLDKEEKKIRCHIKLNKEIDEEIAYGFIDLPTDQIKFMPQAFLLKDSNIFNYQNITLKNFSKEYTITEDIPDYSYTKKAFICSFKTQSVYTITINEDEKMTYFLIGSIVLALIFAIITFFLIRRKQNIPKDPDIYDDNQEEENAN
jgi:hypothetical protein